MDQTPLHFHPPSQFQLRPSAISVAFLVLRMTTLRAQKEAGDTSDIYTFRNIVTNKVSFSFLCEVKRRTLLADTISPKVLL